MDLPRTSSADKITVKKLKIHSLECDKPYIMAILNERMPNFTDIGMGQSQISVRAKQQCVSKV